ncbi:MAG: hypothetical protein R2793_04945 [Flavobacteriaceae bacterium]
MKEVILFGGGGHGFASLELSIALVSTKSVLVYDDHPKGETILRVPLKKYAGDNLSEKNLCIGMKSRRRETEATLFQCSTSHIHPSCCHMLSFSYGGKAVKSSPTVWWTLLVVWVIFVL